MRDGRRLAILVLLDALLTLAVVHRAHQHHEASELRAMAVGVIELSRSRQEARR